MPVYAVAVDLCASGGYYVAVAADKIYADKASLVGSIGVRIDSFGFEDAMKELRRRAAPAQGRQEQGHPGPLLAPAGGPAPIHPGRPGRSAQAVHRRGQDRTGGSSEGRGRALQRALLERRPGRWARPGRRARQLQLCRPGGDRRRDPGGLHQETGLLRGACPATGYEPGERHAGGLKSGRWWHPTLSSGQGARPAEIPYRVPERGAGPVQAV